ncbi:hypothetical protein P8605_43480 [Streptomyces sp. T-3]|nr:hypothetical protein [Streptomyces sp. T-3]
MSDVTDEEIVAALRPILAMTEERDAMAETVERLRTTEDPQELAERDRSGNRMAELDLEICRTSVTALDHIGLWHAAGMIDQALKEPTDLVDGPGPDSTP